MKVIGKTTDGFIIEASEREVSRLIGFYSGAETGHPKLVVGAEIKVSEMYDQLYALRNNRNTLAKEAEKLRMIAGLLENSDPVALAYQQPDDVIEGPI